ncbi:MAG TPA: carboxypeptidase regulatory-like domain-containing protein, partial [Leptospiraceae bacterium]|nr:carboxypeptidase regulatory-like domain-containing protein [Leptospiraceae bacterium]
MRTFKFSIVIVSILVALTACGGKKSKKGFLLFPFGAGMAVLDANGNALPENSGTSQQEAPTAGPAQISGSISPMNGSSAQTGFDFSGIEVSLVDPLGNVIATATPDSFGVYTFDVPDLSNNNYRVLIPDGGGLNQGYVDFNFVFNPSQSGATLVALQPIITQVQQFAAGPAKISGKALTPGYSDGVTTVSAGPLPAGTTVQLLDADDAVIASTTTNASGDYSFNIANLHNGNYSVKVIGSAQSASGRPFTDGSVGFHFAFEGYNIGTATQVNLSPAQCAWTPATQAPASISGQVDNAANVAAASGLTVKLISSGGSVVAQTTTDGSGAFTLSASSVAGGIYRIEISGSAYNTQNASLLFVPLATGASTSVNAGSISVIPKASNIAGTIRDAATSAGIAGAVISFRPAASQPVSKLTYLLTDPVLGAAAARWIAEKNGTGSYSTYLTKSYNGPDAGGNLYMTAVAGKWAYYVSAAGYQSSTAGEITLNGADETANISLTSDPKRSRISGQAVVVDTLIDGSKQSYGATVAGYTNQGYALSGLIVVMLNNRNNAGDAVAHVTTTSAAGTFTFTAQHVVLPAGLTDDSARVAYAASQFAGGNVTTANISGTDSVSDSITTDGTNYWFKSNSYSIYIIDPRGHMSGSLTTATNGSVASNTPTAATTLSVGAIAAHLPRGKISGVVTDAFSTEAISGALVQLGRDTNPDPSLISFSPARKDSNPIANVSRLSNSADVQVADVTTPSNGSYSFDNIDPGDYVLQISKNGYVTGTIPVTVPSNGGSVSVNPPIVVDGP